MKYGVVDAFSRDEGKSLRVPQGKAVHRIDVIRDEASHELLLAFASTFVDLLQTKSLVVLPLATSPRIRACLQLF